MVPFLEKIWITFWKIPRVCGRLYEFSRNLVVVGKHKTFIPVVTFSLVFWNVVAYYAGFQPVFNLTQFPYELITYQFSHGNFSHLIGNLLFLVLFGPKCEKELKHLPFLLFYLLAGGVSATAYSFLTPDAELLGASGAIAGCMGLFPLLHRSLASKVFNTCVVGGFLFLQLQACINGARDVAYLAHLIGVAFGVLCWVTYRTLRKI